MNGSHEELLDDVAAYALGVLPESQASTVRAHLATCETCRAEYDALRPAVTALASSADSNASPLLKARIMRDVRAEAVRKTSRSPWSYVAAASIALAIGTSLWAYALQERVSSLQSQVAHVTNPTNQEQMLADVRSPIAKRYPITDGEVVVVHRAIYFTLVDLPSLPEGKVYQAWTLKKGAKNMAPSVTFSPDARGVALIAIPIDSSTTSAVALSVEPAGGSSQPTSTPLFVRPLSP